MNVKSEYIWWDHRTGKQHIYLAIKLKLNRWSEEESIHF